MRKLLKRRRLVTTSLSALGVAEDMDLDVEDPHREPFSLENAELLKHLLGVLERWPWTKALLVRRYGLDGQGERTFAQLAAEEGLSDGRVQQIITEAIGKMRAAAEEMADGEGAA